MQAVDPAWDPYHQQRIVLGGLQSVSTAIRRGRRLMFVACGTSFHACLACRQTMEELAEMPVRLHCKPLTESMVLHTKNNSNKQAGLTTSLSSPGSRVTWNGGLEC